VDESLEGCDALVHEREHTDAVVNLV
jgi:hypothetical protein